MTRRPRFDGAFFPNARIEGTANATLTDTARMPSAWRSSGYFHLIRVGQKPRSRLDSCARRRRSANENVMKGEMESARRRFVPNASSLPNAEEKVGPEYGPKPAEYQAKYRLRVHD